ncbi:hypothetical protein PIB30_005307 [Stylosanthes scabra]|uniref:Retrotransposon Copia-like N-terminal domain-containing protein n=1 Tax=Stylosanthes scabra TaxID=79078 RepID=A0ABU6U472_9FABA|nr:hypothetical protein [Stylosanthes scabra]
MGLEFIEEFRPITPIRTVPASSSTKFKHVKNLPDLHTTITEQEEDYDYDDDDEECRTPTSPSRTLTPPLVCPPAPKKQRYQSLGSTASVKTSAKCVHTMEQNFAATQNFVATPISMKLDEDNYLQWKDQALSTIEGNDMLNHVTGEGIPQQFAISENDAAVAVNLSYQKWKKARLSSQIVVVSIDEQAVHY